MGKNKINALKICFVGRPHSSGKKIFQVRDQGHNLVGEIRFNNASKDFHCSVKKQFGFVFAERHKSIDDAKKYFIKRFN